MTDLTVSSMQIEVAFYAALAVGTRWVTRRAPGWLADVLNIIAEWLMWGTCVYMLAYGNLAAYQPGALAWFSDVAGAGMASGLIVLVLTRVIAGLVSTRLASVDDGTWFAPALWRAMNAAEPEDLSAPVNDRRDKQVIQGQPDQERAANAYGNK